MSRIKTSEHVFIAGRTGSGKTYWAETYLAGYENVIALDTKGMLEWLQAGEVPIFIHLKDLQQFGKGKAIYRPAPEEMNAEYYNAFFEWIYLRQNTICWIDELMSVCPNASSIPFYLSAIYTRGRQRETTVWACTQRPKTIPLVCMSEATHFIIYDLQMEADRKRVEEVCGSQLFEYTPSQYARNVLKVNEDYLFWYYNFRMDNPVIARLKA